MLREIKREKLPKGIKIFDSNWNRGIMIGNTIIFTGIYKKETQIVEKIYQKDNYTHGFYVKIKKDRVLKIIYIRE